MSPFVAAIVGLGRIGQGYDYDDAGSQVTTHATALARHPGFELAAGVDPDPRQRERFEKKFSRPAYADCPALLRNHRPDVISICTPTALHSTAFESVIDAKPRAVVCEKPLCTDVAAAETMVAAAGRHGCALLVNYMRRFEPGVLRLREQIAARRLGDVYKGVVWYSKGMLNNGSHFVDLATFLLGAAAEPVVLAPGRNWDGHDPEPDARIRCGTADVYFLAAREEHFSVAEFELIGTRGRAAYRDGGCKIEVWDTRPDPDFPGYTVLAKEPETIPHDFMRYQWHVFEHLHRHLALGETLNSTGDTALETLRVVENLTRIHLRPS